MIRLALALAKAGGLVVVFAAVLGGMALVTATGVLVDSAFRAQPPLRLSGADVVVSARQSIPRPEEPDIALPERARIPGSLVASAAGVPGVTAVAGDLSFPAAVVPGSAARTTGDGAVGAVAAGRTADPATAGHGWSSLGLSGRVTAGRAPRAADEIAVSGGRVGDRLRVTAAGTPATYRVTAVVDAPGVYFPDPVAAALAARTAGRAAGRAATVDLVAVRAAPGVSPETLAARLKARLGDGYEYATGRDRADAESPGAAAGRGLLLVLPSSIGGISLLVVGFVVGGGLALSVNRQRRDLALLRAAGATPRQVRRLVAVQAVAAALPAVPPGAALGYFLAARFGELLAGIGLVRADQPLVHGPLPAVAATLLLLGVTRVAAWAGSLRVSRMPVVSGLPEPRTPSPARTRAGLLLMLAALVLSVMPLVVRSEAAVIGPSTAAIVAVIGLALAGPWLVQGAARAVSGSRLMTRLPGPLWLAVHNCHGYALRTAGAVAALGMVVTLGLSVVLTQTTMARARSDEVALGLRGLVTITAPGLGGIPRDLLADVRSRTAAAGMAMTTVVTEPLLTGDSPGLMARPAMALGPDAEGLVDLDLADGRLSGLKGAAVAVDEHLARVGDTMDVIMGDGTRVRARVAATYRRTLGFGPIVVSRDLAAAHTTTGLDSAVLARPADFGDLARRPELRFDSRPEGPQAAMASAQTLVNVAVLAVLLAYVLVAVANRLVATTTARREEFAGLRAIGLTRRQLRRVVRWEALLVGAGASASGLVLSAVPLVLLSVGFLARPLPAGPLWLVPASIVGAMTIVSLAMELPARKIMH
ncbi:FtsX-like permease family protein [Nonomuraea sp. NPDC052265]|uniref:FtsX-like permease family protein n=1 Tax=Nonomuraea sp. NPDC052265 TaxID=3364374 RepID=UPI0037C8FA16